MSFQPFPVGRDPRPAIFNGWSDNTVDPIQTAWGLPEINLSSSAAQQNKDVASYQKVMGFIPDVFTSWFSDTNKSPDANSADDKATGAAPTVAPFITPGQEVLISLALIALVGAALFVPNKLR